ncbi:Enamine deaminase RidA, house cleaning of reactive enamine intermediates, YjgF/YER057c/UK114 family [Granulicella pectinivorans]|uniref:Enamine deaminase RidA, house cleaning of reactive enamine intermediates, YjgF/YER057c/UK114 family n=1 Tax=Granulicella pectinivorans TaxID=474950 RepID=A0A1I6LYI6_9BACT|nr:RidA family protein [Granulicella pectinivorans]SFS08465.1 Enamine deaminase RidA, house cleaning of reactive enamine intermediates, YjgF/YER057c/UK114 family [Granulicella pectinivorans]
MQTRRTAIQSFFAALATTFSTRADSETPAKNGLTKVVHTRGPKPAQTPLYSPAISWGNTLYLSGKSSKDAPPGDIKSDVKFVLAEIEKDLLNAGSSMANVLKVTVYLNDIKDYAAMNEVFRGAFGDVPPARTTVSAAVPRGVSVEIDIIAGIERPSLG